MEIAENHPKRKSSTRSYIPIIISIILLFVLIVITSVILHKVITYQSQPNVSFQNNNADRSVFERYPGYFRTETEQSLFTARIQNMTVRDKNLVPANEVKQTCFVQCSKNTGYTPVIPIVPDVNHGCCISQQVYISPDTWVDFEGVTRTIAQFDGSRQYFLQESCSQVSGCTGCTCQQLASFATAVYVDSGNVYGVSWFSIDTCCKCVNSY